MVGAKFAKFVCFHFLFTMLDKMVMELFSLKVWGDNLDT